MHKILSATALLLALILVLAGCGTAVKNAKLRAAGCETEAECREKVPGDTAAEKLMNFTDAQKAAQHSADASPKITAATLPPSIHLPLRCSAVYVYFQRVSVGF